MQKGDNVGMLSHVKITEYPLGDYKSPLLLNTSDQNIKQLLWSGPGLQCRQKLQIVLTSGTCFAPIIFIQNTSTIHLCLADSITLLNCIDTRSHPLPSLHSIIIIFLGKCTITHNRINTRVDAVKQSSKEAQLGTLMRDKAGRWKPALPQGEKLPHRISNHVSPQAAWHMDLLISGVEHCDGRGCPWEWPLGTAIWAEKEEGNNLFSEK